MVVFPACVWATTLVYYDNSVVYEIIGGEISTSCACKLAMGLPDSTLVSSPLQAPNGMGGGLHSLTLVFEWPSCEKNLACIPSLPNLSSCSCENMRQKSYSDPSLRRSCC